MTLQEVVDHIFERLAAAEADIQQMNTFQMREQPATKTAPAARSEADKEMLVVLERIASGAYSLQQCEAIARSAVDAAKGES